MAYEAGGRSMAPPHRCHTYSESCERPGGTATRSNGEPSFRPSVVWRPPEGDPMTPFPPGPRTEDTTEQTMLLVFWCRIPPPTRRWGTTAGPNASAVPFFGDGIDKCCRCSSIDRSSVPSPKRRMRRKIVRHPTIPTRLPPVRTTAPHLSSDLTNSKTPLDATRVSLVAIAYD